MDVPSLFLSVQGILILTISLLFGFYFLFWIVRRSPKNLPPGPRDWGTNWIMLKASWNGTLHILAGEWALKYKEITLVNSFGMPVVFLNTAEITRKLLASEKYKFLVADRFPNAAARIVEFNGRDLIFSKFDAIMKKKRRLFYNVIGLYGNGVAKMFTDIDLCEGKDTDLTSILTRSLKVIIYILVTGELPVDPSAPDMLEEYDLAFNKLATPDVDFVLDNLPFLTKIPGKFKRAVDRAKEAKKKADELLYYRQKRTHKPGQPRGIADLLLDYAKKPGYEWMDEDEGHIISFLAILIQEEIDDVIGSKRPKLEYKSRLPYTEATILEGVRLISPVPLNAFRRPFEDIDFEGMVIPKKLAGKLSTFFFFFFSIILINSWHFLHDENKWEDPWTFNPKRFLDNEGNLLPADHPKRKDLIAFGVGARACPGETFSRSRMFLFITSILQRYDLLPPSNEKLTPANFNVHDETILGIVRQTPPFKCRLVRRKRR
ncbi:unnamed protein product [Candidula unifasciata]|uniref:Cytochrome P450 n=1 Tax=Candidula unifasciata TaxID=100452 RepID=A0A8S3ZLV3_9EUPU|nr:unnamed protein product [Candidula unifasciata]